MNTSSSKSEQWLTSPLTTEESLKLQAQLEATVEQRAATQTYSKDERDHIKARKIFTQLDHSIPVKHLDAIRRLCQLWDVQLVPKNIQSHRKFLGPIIVWAKSKIFPLVELVFKDSLRQQREFNAAAIEAISEISAKK